MKLISTLKALALIVAVAGVASAQLTTSGAAAAIDNIPPAPVTNLIAADTPEKIGTSITLSWSPSVDDARSFTTFGNAVVPRGGVQGYNIYRKVDEGVDELLAGVGAGTAGYVDNTVVSGTTYIYSVRPFDLDNETDFVPSPGTPADLARVIVAGGGGQKATIVTTVKAALTFEVEIDLGDEAAVGDFEENFIASVAALLGIDPSRIVVTGIAAGSIIVSFEILDVEEIGDQVNAEAALNHLQTLTKGDPEVLADLGTIQRFVDETTTEVVVKVSPVDEDGQAILGWFTRLGKVVSFDDFFAFADHFGEEMGDETYDSTFDISPNGKIDFDDFFVFVDDFGKTVANADEVRASESL